MRLAVLAQQVPPDASVSLLTCTTVPQKELGWSRVQAVSSENRIRPHSLVDDLLIGLLKT